MNILLEETIISKASKIILEIGKFNVHVLNDALPIQIFEVVLLKQHFVKLGLIDSKGNLLHNDKRLIEERISSQNKTTTNFQLSKKFHTELSAFAEESSALIGLLFKDSKLGKGIDSNKLKLFLIHDFSYISKLVNDINQHTNLIEFALCYLLNFTNLQNFNGLFRSNSYEYCKEAFEKNNFKSYSKILLRNISNQNKSSDYSNLILLNELIKSNHTLYEEYAILLIKYSNLLVYADEFLSVSEDELIKDLHRHISDPERFTN